MKGADLLVRGAGADRFDFNSIKETGNLRKYDRIVDFKRKQDKIDLSDIDARSGKKGDQALDFIDGAKFHRKAGELRYDDGVLAGDTNGDGRADFKIDVARSPNLSDSDFIL